MQLLKERFLEKYAFYPSTYEDFMRRLTRVKDVSKSAGSDEEQFERGKAFGTVYECFMYATIVGIKARHQAPSERNAAGPKFLQIKDWKPQPLVDFIFMGLLTLAKFPFEEIEELSPEQADERGLDLVKTMEKYAAGGFELMLAKSKELPQFFENPGNVVTFLKEVTLITQ